MGTCFDFPTRLTKGFLVDAQLKVEAQEAIRWIQGRIAGGDTGGLSVVRDDERVGSLSVADEAHADPQATKAKG